jgi:hypothetical protein
MAVLAETIATQSTSLAMIARLCTTAASIELSIVRRDVGSSLYLPMESLNVELSSTLGHSTSGA